MVPSAYSHKYRRGWFGESYRHYLASKGFSTSRKRYFYKGNKLPSYYKSGFAEGKTREQIEGELASLGRTDLIVEKSKRPSIYARVVGASAAAPVSTGPIPLVAGPPMREALPAPEPVPEMRVLEGPLPEAEGQEYEEGEFERPDDDIDRPGAEKEWQGYKRAMERVKRRKPEPIATPGTPPGPATGFDLL